MEKATLIWLQVREKTNEHRKALSDPRLQQKVAHIRRSFRPPIPVPQQDGARSLDPAAPGEMSHGTSSLRKGVTSFPGTREIKRDG